ncbi:MAG: hypothetical protein V3U37_07640, partial [Nitrospinaceae bacterium]
VLVKIFRDHERRFRPGIDDKAQREEPGHFFTDLGLGARRYKDGQQDTAKGYTVFSHNLRMKTESIKILAVCEA